MLSKRVNIFWENVAGMEIYCTFVTYLGVSGRERRGESRKNLN